MNRRITNAIRFVMDELVPPIIRDSKFFMYPFFRLAYRGQKISEIMDFKKRVYSFSRDDYAEFYSNLNSISRRRETDLNGACIDAILGSLDSDDRNVIDVGCGGGYLLKRIQQVLPESLLAGYDVTERPSSLPSDIQFVRGDIMDLDLPAECADVVTCCHVLEHILDYRSVLKKLITGARKKVILVVPLQRPYFYTLDEHVNFFLFPEQFVYEVGIKNHHWQRIDGDLFYIGIKS
ncbi:MAG: class I SAM-dependent methyltransferase [Xanthomonadales bacterium]|nr:class I SAM-dependent methyltransferase [Xanthomonadales bacterium]